VPSDLDPPGIEVALESGEAYAESKVWAEEDDHGAEEAGSARCVS
jgi:hypothetical protein